MSLRCVCLVVWAALSANLLAQDTGAAGLAAAAGIKAGVCVLPRVSDASELLNWAGLPGFTVHAQTGDEAQVLSLRRAAAEKGILARSVYVARGDVEHLVLADRYAELVVVGDATEADLTPKMRDEWMRVLIPGRGCLMLKAGGGVEEKTVKTWLGSGPEIRVIKANGAEWIVARRGAIAGTDEWTHRNRDAANSRVSTDASIKPPFITQWWDFPLHEGFWGTTLVAGNGRSHTLWMGGWPNQKYALVTRSLGNGAPLWERTFAWSPPRDTLAAGYYPGRSCMVLEGDRLYLALEADIEQLNAETGEVQGKITGPIPGGQVKWFGIEGGVLVLLAGEADKYKYSSLQNELLNPYGSSVAAYDLKAGGKQLWCEKENGNIDHSEIAIRGDSVFIHAQGARVVARDLKTGKVKWENTDSKTLGLLADRTERNQNMLVSVPILTAAPQLLFFSAAWLKNQVALDPEKGTLLWSQPAGKYGRVLQSLVMDGKVRLSGAVLDGRTGAKISDDKLPTSGCGPTKAVPGLFLTTFASCVPVDGTAPVRTTDVKGPCDAGPIVVDGMVLNASGRCKCNLEMQGYRVFLGAGAFEPHAAGDDAGRLVKGPASDEAFVKTASDPRDWATYRHDAARSGASPVSVGTATRILWQNEAPKSGLVPPPPAGQTLPNQYYAEHIPTQAAAAEGRIVQGGADGVIRCFEAGSGKLVWDYPVGSKIFAVPALSCGRVYAGAGDGWVYCLRLKDGVLAWRVRAAPVERRITWYGHVTSTWPLTGGVVVQDGIVYAVAGYQDHNGIHVWALDAANGGVKWSSHDAAKDVEKAMASFGYTTIAAGRLWLCTSSVVPGSFDLATGEKRVLPNTQFGGHARRGMEIGAIGNDWIMFGGRRLSHPMLELWKEREKNTGISLVNANAKLKEGEQVCFGVEAIDECEFLPVTDGELTVAIQSLTPRTGRVAKLYAWPTSSLVSMAGTTVEPKPQFLPKRDPLYLVPTGQAAKDPVVPPLTPVWPPVVLNAIGLVLTQDMVVVAHATGGAKESFPDKWAVSAVDRKDGQVKWSVALPEAPVYEGISMDRDGHVLVALQHGGLLAIGK